MLHISRLSLFSVAQQTESGLGRVSIEVPRSHTTRSERARARTHTYTHTHTHTHTHDKNHLSRWSARRRSRYLHSTQKLRTSMHSAGFETTIPATEQQHTYALHRTTIGVCSQSFTDTQKWTHVGNAAYGLYHYVFTYVTQHDLQLLFNSSVPRLFCSA
jgi:hypothetical protein